MSSLAELQKSFGGFLYAPPGEGLADSLQVAVRRHGADAAGRLAVYKNNVYSRLIDALVSTYPAVQRLVGEDFFRYAAQEFIASQAARSKSLLLFSKSFADFIESFPAASSVPYLADVARLEYIYLLSYHAPDAQPLKQHQFLEYVAANAGAKLALHPSAFLMSSRYPVARIWEANASEEPIDGKISINGNQEFLLVIRPQVTVEVRTLTRSAFFALRAISKGLSYADALVEGRQAAPDDDVQTQLQSLAGGETFVSEEELSNV